MSSRQRASQTPEAAIPHDIRGCVEADELFDPVAYTATKLCFASMGYCHLPSLRGSILGTLSQRMCTCNKKPCHHCFARPLPCPQASGISIFIPPISVSPLHPQSTDQFAIKLGTTCMGATQQHIQYTQQYTRHRFIARPVSRIQHY